MIDEKKSPIKETGLLSTDQPPKLPEKGIGAGRTFGDGELEKQPGHDVDN